ncbi:MAG: histidine kinase dimerization/phospho-acceptor domain-containing protein, partial [Eubacterium sp.]
MNKKKLYALTLLVLLVFFLFSAYMSFASESSLISSEYVDACNYSVLRNESYSKEYTVDEYIENSLLTYPTLISVFDSKGNLVQQSGSFLKMYIEDSEKDSVTEKYIYIDKYLNTQTKELLTKLQNNSFYEIYELDYFEENNDIIPVYMKLVNTNPEYNKITIELYPYDEIKKDTQLKTFTGYCGYKFINIDEKSIDCRTYENMQNSHEAFASEIKESSLTSGGGFYGPESTESRKSVSLSDGEYYVYATTAIRPVLYVLTSSRFWNSIATQALCIGVIGVALLITVKKFYEKNKRMEESKQAFTSAAAHELKTPLAVIQNQCECVIENVAPQKNNEYINSIYEESLRMNKLVATLLQYNRLASCD